MDMLQFFEHIEDNNLTPNQYYVLWSIHMKRKPKHINNSLELRQLQNEQWVDEEYKLLAKASDFLDNMSKEVPNGKVNNKTFDVEEYLDVFPRGKLPSGKPARVNKKTVADGFTWFLKNYDYKWETIIEATKMYVDEYETKNYLYMRNSQYFIRKNNVDKTWDSELANYCELVLTGYTGEDSNHFSEKVV